MTKEQIPQFHYAVIVLKTRQVIATGLTKWQAKQRCREWNRRATVETWAAWTTRPIGACCQASGRKGGVS